jgi:multiple sugar transport system permease protein
MIHEAVTPPPRRRRAEEASGERGLISPLERRRVAARVGYWALFGALALLTLTTIFPLYWMASGGLKTAVEVVQPRQLLLPLHPQWSVYADAWGDLHYATYFFNTLALAGGAWALQMAVSATAAFALSKLRPAFGNVLLGLFASTLLVPPVAYLIPQYLNIDRLPLAHLNLVGTWWGVWLPEAVNGFNLFVLKSFFDGIPDELIEAARLDGANAWRIFVNIMAPLSRSVLAVVTILTVMASWKDFLWPYIVLTDPSKQPIMVGLYRNFAQQTFFPLNTEMAALTIASIPPIVLFLLFQRQIVRGIALTGLTGS